MSPLAYQLVFVPVCGPVPTDAAASAVDAAQGVRQTPPLPPWTPGCSPCLVRRLEGAFILELHVLDRTELLGAAAHPTHATALGAGTALTGRQAEEHLVRRPRLVALRGPRCFVHLCEAYERFDESTFRLNEAQIAARLGDLAVRVAVRVAA